MSAGSKAVISTCSPIICSREISLAIATSQRSSLECLKRPQALRMRPHSLKTQIFSRPQLSREEEVLASTKLRLLGTKTRCLKREKTGWTATKSRRLTERKRVARMAWPWWLQECLMKRNTPTASLNLPSKSQPLCPRVTNSLSHVKDNEGHFSLGLAKQIIKALSFDLTTSRNQI